MYAKYLITKNGNAFLGTFLWILASCHQQTKAPTDQVQTINLKRGEPLSCGPGDKSFGTVAFLTSCPQRVQKDFNLGLALLHSFEYEDAEKVFASIIDKEPACAMAYWGVAMSNYHPLWAPPTQMELEKGAKALAIARSLDKKSPREAAYIDAIGSFYADWEKTDHQTRAAAFGSAMEKVYTAYPADQEAAIFYALALTAGAAPTDKAYSNQKKAGKILNGLYRNKPSHPGIIHYIIHSYDYPELATLALPAARTYASIAPSSAHAQHMPSHIFTRLGLWDEDIRSNLASVSSAKCYAENTGMKGHWDEELHGLDYLEYAYLQRGDNAAAKKYCDYLKSINNAEPLNFKVAYAFAAIPARYALENKQWQQAASLPFHPSDFPWEKFPWQKGIVYFARLLGLANTGQIKMAERELAALRESYGQLMKQKNIYEAGQVQIQIMSGQSWILFRNGKNAEALALMDSAANMEDRTEKHPVTPGEVLPAREQLADMLLQMNRPQQALIAYEESLKSHANRFNGLFGAALAAQHSNQPEKAHRYYKQLVAISTSQGTMRGELAKAKTYLQAAGY